MLKRERQAYILCQINLHNRVLSSDLSLEMKVLDDTTRRDLIELSDYNKFIKVHVGHSLAHFIVHFYGKYSCG